MRHRDCEVHITCDGRTLDEYNVEVEGNVVECYVASEAGKTFKIKCSNHSLEHVSVLTAVDGQQFPRPEAMSGGRLNRTLRCEDGRVDGTRTLLFAEIPITDDENAPREIPDGKRPGTIEVKITRSRLKRKTSWAPSRKTKAQPENIETLHETTKKSGMHCVSFGKTILCCKPTNTKYVTRIDRWSAPYVTFKFHYRPHAILKARGIIEIIELNGLDGTAPGDGVFAVQEDPLTPTTLPGVVDVSLRPKRRDGSQAQADMPRKRLRRDSNPQAAEPPTEDRLSTTDAEDAKPLVVKGEVDDGVEDVDALEAQIRALRQRVDRANTMKAHGGQSRVVKREVSPIRLGGFNGGVIDLTDD
ncbi:hypothetical protein EVJ58_g2561 [Rhodofomes roseus]|uniref:DUF7918 domain-containing protein n=1 Tax=Rhodofomes roseus TaxID=34475 RepID=A0A4Y9YS57_9APHY|nr:hypothetical protein EVJ58_g2561 [Rhodofomes roseus]